MGPIQPLVLHVGALMEENLKGKAVQKIREKSFEERLQET